MTVGALGEDELTERLRESYDAGAERRATTPKSAWKLRLRDEFLERILAEGARTLLEPGAGTGDDSRFFQDAGLDVLAFDLSPEMVRRCRAKGVNAQVAELSTFDVRIAATDAIWTMNCLLHVPTDQLPDVLDRLRSVLRPGGLFFCGTYGGDDDEGVLHDDSHDPPRFFALRRESTLRAAFAPLFHVVDYELVGKLGGAPGAAGWPFHAFNLRRP